MTTGPSGTNCSPSDMSWTTASIDATTTRTQSEVEREILCDYVETLEQELVRERHRREQVVAQYERLLEAERQSNTESPGLLGRLF